MPEQHESAVLIISDVHFGKVTSSFNPDICAEKILALGDKLTRIRELLGAYAFDELVVCLLGDIVDGTGIYPTQYHHQTLTSAQEQADIMADMLRDVLKYQPPVWSKVRVEAVPGNHGRSGKFTHEIDNYDLLCYKHLRDRLEKYGICVNTSSGDPFIHKIDIRGHKYVLYHGSAIKMYQSIPWYGIAQRMLKWATTRALMPFDALLLGHFHSLGFWPINSVNVFTNGTAVTNDEWALQILGYESTSKFWLFGVSDKYPVTWSFGLDLA